RAVRCVRVSADQKFVVSAGANGQIQIFDQSSLSRLQTIEAGHGGYCWSVNITPNSQNIISGGEDGIVKLWNINTGAIVREFHGHSGAVWSVAVSSNGNEIVCGGETGRLSIWDLNGSGVQVKKVIKGHIGYVLKVDVSHASANADYVISCGDLGNVQIWNARINQDESQGRGGAAGRVLVAKISKDGNTLVSAGDEGIVRVWDLKTKKPKASFVGHYGRIGSIAVSEDGDLVASAGHDGTVRVWVVSKEHEPHKVLEGHSGAVRAVCLVNNGSQLVTSGHDKTVRYWDTQTGKNFRVSKGHQGKVIALGVANLTSGKTIYRV
ncbi:hypothetical protein HK096_009570, partial [Nowakowskiella sp. JEL0078]